MIDFETGRFKIRETKNKEAMEIAKFVEVTWLTRYPWPNEITFDKGTEIMGEFARMIECDYRINRRGTIVRNPQASGILERIHQTLGNMLKTFKPHEDKLDNANPWEGILEATMFALRAASASSMQFGRDAIINIPYQVDWDKIKERKQSRIHKSNEKENSSQIPHKYSLGNKVLLRREDKGKYANTPYEGPHVIKQINNNGTVRIKKPVLIETVTIRLIKPYKE